MNKFIPVCEPYLVGDERKFLMDAYDEGWISAEGKYSKLLDKEFSNFSGCNFGTNVSNGTVALHLALKALGLKSGDEVIIPNHNGIYSLFALLYENIKPILVEADPNTWNMDTSLIEKKITKKTKAIIVVHLYGNLTDMKQVMKISKKYNLRVIEDCAEAHGAQYEGKSVGSFGDIATYSFFANKIITSGEGGFVCSNNKKLIDRCRYFKNQCFKLNGPRDFIHNDLGYNYRMTNLQAAVAYGQLKNIKKLIKARNVIMSFYKEELSQCKLIEFQKETQNSKPVNWQTCILLKKKNLRNRLEKFLNNNNIQTRRLFVGLNKQPVLKKYKFYKNLKKEKFQISDMLGNNGMYIPTSGHLDRKTIRYISNKIKEFLKDE